MERGGHVLRRPGAAVTLWASLLHADRAIVSQLVVDGLNVMASGTRPFLVQPSTNYGVLMLRLTFLQDVGRWRTTLRKGVPIAGHGKMADETGERRIAERGNMVDETGGRRIAGRGMMADETGGSVLQDVGRWRTRLVKGVLQRTWGDGGHDWKKAYG